MEVGNFSGPRSDDGQKESASTKDNAAEPQTEGRQNTMEHLTLLRVDSDSFSAGARHCKKSFQSTLSKYTESAIN